MGHVPYRTVANYPIHLRGDFFLTRPLGQNALDFTPVVTFHEVGKETGLRIGFLVVVILNYIVGWVRLNMTKLPSGKLT